VLHPRLGPTKTSPLRLGTQLAFTCRRASVWRTLLRNVRFRRADGEYRWFLVQALPLRNEEGKIVEWYGTNK